MKRLLSILLAFTMCLSCVIILASCAGKSAYELAKENGLTTAATEAEWIASLQGTNGADGVIDFSSLTFTVNAEGYLVINGHATTQKVAEIPAA